MILVRAHIIERILPVYCDQSSAFTQNTPRFFKDPRLVFNLKKEIRADNSVKKVVGKARAMRLLKVTLYVLDIFKAFKRRQVRKTLKHVAANIYGIHDTARPHSSGNRARKKA